MGTPLRVLIVEDSEDDALLLLRELRRGGYAPLHERVCTAASMAAALERDWDVVVSDFNMPDFDGPAALKVLQRKGLDVPFILVSGKIGEEVAVSAMKAGASDFVPKDNLRRLVPVIERELRDAENRRQRRLAEDRLRSSERSLRNVVTNNADGMVILDKQGKTLFMNPAAEALFGRQGTGAPGLFGVPIGARNPIELDIVTGNGERAWAEVRAAATEWEGEPVYLVTLRDVTERKRAEEERRHLTRRLVEVQEEERRSIARELHDQTGQLLTGIRMLLDRASRSPDTCLHLIGEAQTVAAELIDQVRHMSFQLRPSTLDDLGLVPTLLMHFERFAKQTQVQVDFQRDQLPYLPADISTAIYRIVQEALTNVARHAGVRRATVCIWNHNEAVCVEVSDRGNGFSEGGVRSSNGLSGMRERARLLGGKLTVESAPGAGTRVCAEIPLPKATQLRAEDSVGSE
ncbi:MAG: response regulator [Chloroflexi bacterium]|nr:response regulator [Chloroflexota bacterium]